MWGFYGPAACWIFFSSVMLFNEGDALDGPWRVPVAATLVVWVALVARQAWRDLRGARRSHARR